MMSGSNIVYWLLWSLWISVTFQLAGANTLDKVWKKATEQGGTARLLGGDFSQLNAALFDIEIQVETESLEPDPVNVAPGVDAVIELGNGYCTNIQVRPEGDIQLLSQLGPTYIDPVDNVEYERYTLDLRAIALTFVCYVEMNVELFGFGFVPLSGNSGGFGTLVFSPSETGVPPGAFLNTSIDIFAEDFTTQVPSFAIPTGCVADITDLNYDQSTNLGSAIIIGDITSTVVDTLKDDKTLVEEPVEAELCGLLANVSKLISDLIVDNPLTNVTLQETDILSAENSLTNISEDVDLLDWGDNVLTDFLFPENQESSVLDGFLGNGSISGILGDFLGIDVGEGGGLNNFDVLPLVGPLIDENYTDPSLPLLNISTNLLNISSLRMELYVEYLNISTTKVDVDLSSLSFPGSLTITLPTVDLGDIDIIANVRVLVTLDEILFSDISLPSLFLDETFQFQLDWNSFTVNASIFAPVNLNAIPSLEFGGLTSDTLNCLLSTLYVSPMLTQLYIGSSSIGLQVNGFEDAIAFFVGEAVNSVFPVLEGSAKLFVDSLIDSLLVNQELLQVPTCPLASIQDDLLPYDFSQGIFKTVSDFITEDLIEEAVGSLVGNDTALVLLDETSNISLSLDITGGTGINFNLHRLGFFGLQPPTINQITLLRAVPSSPQELVNILNAGSSANPLGVEVVASLDFTENGVTSSKNKISISLSFATIEAALMILAKLSKYDVDSMTLEKILNINCWIGRLDKPGGVTDLSLIADGLDIETSCDCELVPLDQIVSAISTPGLKKRISDLIDELLDVVEYVVETPFSPSNWDLTITNANRRCNGLDPLPTETGLLEPPQDDYTIPQALGGLLIFALNVTFIFSCCCLKKKGKSRPMIKPEHEDEQSDAPTSLFKSPSLSKYARFGFPFAIFINLAVLVVGDFYTAISVDVEVELLGVRIDLEEIAELSVVSSTEKVIAAGAWGLAIMLVVLVLMWPYLKLVTMLVSWFLPTNLLSRKRRTILLDLLDKFGKWSFVEFYFISFILLTFATETKNPLAGFVPDDAQVLSIALILVIERGTFIFMSAILMSIVLSNISIFLDAKTHPSIGYKKDEKEGFSVAFTGFKNENATGPDDEYLRTTLLGQIFFSVTILGTFALIIALVDIPIVQSEFIGLIGVLKRLDGEDVYTEFSIKELLVFAFDSDIQPAGYVFLGMITLTTAILMPLVQQLHLLYIFFAKQTAEEVYHSIRLNKVFTAWCCLEVLVLGLVVAVLEVKFVSKSIVEKECEALKEPLTQLANAGFLEPEDADAVCYAVVGTVSPLFFIFIFAIIMYKCTTYLVLSLLELSANQHKGMVDTVEASTNHSFAYKLIRGLQFVEVSDKPNFPKPEQLTFDNIVEVVKAKELARNGSSRNPMYSMERRGSDDLEL